MQPYANLSGQSGVVAYAIEADAVRLRFQGGDEYRYTAAGVGRDNLEQMVRLARQGRGLATFISRTPAVRDGYSRHDPADV